MIKLSLPIPVTINHAYKNAGKRRTLTKSTKIWKMQAAHDLQGTGALTKHAKVLSENRAIRDSCVVVMGKQIKVSIYELRKKFDKSYAVTYRFYFGNDSLRDVANFEKLLTDFLCDHNFLVDDQFIKEMHLYGMDIDEKNPRVEIEIKTIDQC